MNQTWVILPNMNPDGYRYTYQQDRLWRKNRADTNQSCLGVDLNRNHDYNWHKAKGASTDSCSEVYRGKEVEGQIETKVKRDFLANKWNSTVFYLSIHNAADAIFVPPGDLDVEIEQLDDLYEMARLMKKAIGRAYVPRGRDYKV